MAQRELRRGRDCHRAEHRNVVGERVDMLEEDLGTAIFATAQTFKYGGLDIAFSRRAHTRAKSETKCKYVRHLGQVDVELKGLTISSWLAGLIFRAE